MIVRDFLAVLRRRWLVLAICVAVGILVGGLGGLFSKSSYTSTTRMLVTTPNIDQSSQVPPGGISASQRAVNYASLITGTVVPQRVVDELGLTEPIPVLLQELKVTVLANTTVIEIKVTDPSAAEAQRIAAAFAQQLVAYVPTVEQKSGEASSVVTVVITDPANLPQLPAAGGVLSDVALGIVAGIVVGAALIWLLEFLDTRVRRPRKLVEVSGRAVLGAIAAGPDPAADELITAAPAHSELAESYRSLRTTLQFVDIASSTPIFVVAGPRPGTGATTLASNIAASMAQAGQRTLLVEADLHRPRLTELLGLVAGHPGLAEVLGGTVPVAEATQRWTAAGVDVVVGGTPPGYPTELVQSKAMDALLAKLRGEYDVVVLDAPPLLDVTDGALLTSAADGAILAVRYAVTRQEDVTESVARLSVVKAPLLGSVVVGMPPAAARGVSLAESRPAGTAAG